MYFSFRIFKEVFCEEEYTDIWEEEEATTEGKYEFTLYGCDIEEGTVDPCESGLVGVFEDFEDSFFILDLHCSKKFLLMYSHTLELNKIVRIILMKIKRGK